MGSARLRASIPQITHIDNIRLLSFKILEKETKEEPLKLVQNIENIGINYKDGINSPCDQGPNQKFNVEEQNYKNLFQGKINLKSINREEK